MKLDYIFGIIIIILIILIIFKKKEHLTAASNEAIQNVAKIYADASGTVAFNNVNANGTIDLINPEKTTENTAKKWRFQNRDYAPGAGNSGLEIWQFDGKTGAGTNNYTFEDRGVFTAKNIYTSNWIHANGTIVAKQNRARYIRIGNALESGIARREYWTIKEVEVYDFEGTNVAKNKPVTVLKGSANFPGDSNWAVPGNIVNGDSKVNDIGDYHGSAGENELEIDLGQEYDITQINVFNRFHDQYTQRADNTSIQLLDKNKVRNRVIHTGNWYQVYSKEYILN
jgi:hypothetical protein